MATSRALLVVALVIGLLASLGGTAAAQEEAKPGVRRGKEWHLRESLSSGPADIVFRYGRVDDAPIMCDWDGDGTATPGAIRHTPGGRHEWHLRDDLSGGSAHTTFVYGLETDRVVCGDWDGDGRDTPGVVRKLSTGHYEWHLRNALRGGGADLTFVYGRDVHGDPDQFPVGLLVGDWNASGRDTVGIVRHEPDDTFQWHLRNRNRSGVADIVFDYHEGAVSGDDQHFDRPIVGDWNGDGRDTAGVVRARLRSPQWLLRDEHSDGPPDHAFRYGAPETRAWTLVWH